MHHRSTPLTAGAAVLLAGLANAQSNEPFQYNWASLAAAPAAFVVGPASFGGALSLGDSMRLCYSVDRTQGGRNEGGQSFISYFAVTQAYGSSTTSGLVNIGQVAIGSRISDDLLDDACLAEFAGLGTVSAAPDLLLGAPGPIAGTGGASLAQGTFWTLALNFLGSVLPGIDNTGGSDPGALAGTPLLSHLIYEVQGPVSTDPVTGLPVVDPGEIQYFLISTVERNGVNPAATGGVTNGNTNFGLNAYGVTADQSGAVSHSRFTTSDSSFVLTGAGVLNGGGAFGTTEWLGALAFQTPYLNGINTRNSGGSGADWVLSGGNLSRIDLKIIDKRAGAEDPASGSSLANPFLIVNQAIVLWSATPAATMQQSPFSWDDLGGVLPPKAGTYTLPPQSTTRAGLQTPHVNFDATTGAFLDLGLSFTTNFSATPTVGGIVGADLFDIQNTSLGGIATLASGPIDLGIPIPSAAGTRLGLHAVGFQFASDVGVVEFTEFTNALTAVLQ